MANKWYGIKPRDVAVTVPLSHFDCAAIDEYLASDSASVTYSSLVSVGDAIRAIEAGFYSWSIVKLYYSVFYSLRALMACDSVAVFYVGSSPFWITVSPGERPHAGKTSSSHKLIMDLFKKEFSGSPLLSQSIGFDDPLVWIQKQREFINYSQAKFPEPVIPKLFANI
jgi:hypothetical protein